MTWLTKIASEQYLQSLGIAPDIIAYVMSIQQPQRQQLINAVRKNPQITLVELQNLPLKQKENTYTESELFRTQHLDEPFRTWALIQYRKHRKKKIPLVPYYEYEPWITDIDGALIDIHDWWQQTNVNITSYTLETAQEESENWHRRMFSDQAVEGEYDPLDRSLIVYGPNWENPEWRGWTVQQIVSANDLEIEGNRMGHCSGTYCEQVASKSTFIYSLRDPSNHPHATIEIDSDDTVVQIRGKGNIEPIDIYKNMIAEWFSELKKTKPKLQWYYAGEYDFTKLKYVNNRDMDDEIAKILDQHDAYGLDPPITNIDIRSLYEIVMDELTRNNRNYDFVGYMASLASTIVDLAWQIDKQLAADFNWSIPEDASDRTGEHYFKSRLSQVYQLEDIIDRHNEHFYESFFDNTDYIPEPVKSDFQTQEEYTTAYREWEERQEEEQNYAYTKYLPTGFDHVMFQEIQKRKKEDPILPSDKKSAEIIHGV